MIINRELDCLAPHLSDDARPIWAILADELPAFLAGRPASEAAFLRQSGFAGKEAELCLLPGPEGVAGAVVGLGAVARLAGFGDLPRRLPEGSLWHLQPGSFAPALAQLGFCLGAYRFETFKPAAQVAARRPVLLCCPDADATALSAARAAWMVRDLINLPAGTLGPAELAEAALALGDQFGAVGSLVTGAALAEQFPTIQAVGGGSDRPPVMARLDWRGPGVTDDAPLVVLCGKGVCFDSGGYDLKPSSGMLRMKKDMGGAAILLGVARMVMQAALPIRLTVLLGCVENSVSGRAMRPMDVLRTRSGRTVEIGNTDAEGRLVLCDLLDLASSLKPALVVDAATLTGAARAALGPDLPALFCNDEGWAADLLAAAAATDDPLWRLPLWDGYDTWLESNVAEMNNVSTRPFAGAIVAALFLRRFVAEKLPWAHLDVYAWNDANRPARPEGGEAQTMRAIYFALASRFAGASVTLATTK